MSTTQTVQLPQKGNPINSPYWYLTQEDPNFLLWYKNIKRGRVSTAYEWVRKFGQIHTRFDKKPADIAKMSVKEAGDFLLDMISRLEEEKKSGNYISNYIKPVKSWLNFNDVYVQKKIKIKDRHKLTKFDKERVPTQTEVGQIIGAGDYRSKTMCTLMPFSSFRPEVFGNYLGNDGLMVKDFPEMVVDPVAKKVTFTKIPTMVVVRDSLSKAGHEFFSFYHAEGCTYLARLLESRMEGGEPISADSPIFTQKKLVGIGKHRVAFHGFLRTSNLTQNMKKAITDAGYSWRPYVLRRYFDTRMMLAEADGIIIRDWRVFWMGHKGSMEAVYTVNKGLSEDVIEKMRAAYAKAADRYLTTTSIRNEGTQDMVRAEMYKTVLEMAQFTPQEIESLGDLSKLNSSDITKILEEKQKANIGLKNGGSQKVVLRSEVREYLTQGWTFVDWLTEDEAIIGLSSSR